MQSHLVLSFPICLQARLLAMELEGKAGSGGTASSRHQSLTFCSVEYREEEEGGTCGGFPVPQPRQPALAPWEPLPPCHWPHIPSSAAEGSCSAESLLWATSKGLSCAALSTGHISVCLLHMGMQTRLGPGPSLDLSGLSLSALHSHQRLAHRTERCPLRIVCDFLGGPLTRPRIHA